ncbi:MAG: hypothetical protein JNL43_02385 [Flavobacteriales bacterium]|nr:hypothetical protein [Flavobacteriales bacterium]
MRFLLFPLLAFPVAVNAQVDLPVFGKQQVINGYAKDVEGEVLSYFSVYPEHATTALLTRCTDGTKAIAWETAVVPHYPQDEMIQYYYFSWIAAHNSTTSGGDRSFDLYINDTEVLTFTTHHSTSPGTWSAVGADSTKLVFEFSKKDRHGDAHGFAHLRVPGHVVTPGKPLRLKVVGHAQDSPDWFMTFRYTFEEKVEVEALPFTPANTRIRMQPLLFTAMHFGGPTQLDVVLDGAKKPITVPITNGLNVFEESIAASPVVRDVALQVKNGSRVLLDTVLQVKPVIHREIHLVHHSHTDIGYSHLQAEVERIQNNNLWKALELIDHTKDHPEGSRFVWNVESLWAVENFLGIASEQDKQRFIAAVKSGSIALSANYANILTGLCTPEEMHWIVEYADSLRAWYDVPITMAMQTDIPGMSWSMVDAYAAHGIRHLSQGPNYIPDMPDGGDRIGSTLREQGDKPYWWKGTTGKDSILVWTAGQGYGGWHGYTAGAIKERGTRKIAAYMNELAVKGYPYDMVQWRYNIVSDNGPVDSTLSDFVREWNSTYASPRLIIANAGTMMQEFEDRYGKSIPTWSGDFTPYWEDGAYSTAKEEGDVRVLSARLTNLIEAAKILGKPIDPHLLYRAKRSIVMWHEHTWGAWCSISDPDAHFTTDQWRVKKDFADSAGWYVKRIEADLLPHSKTGNELSVLDPLGSGSHRTIELNEGFDRFNEVIVGDSVVAEVLWTERNSRYFIEPANSLGELRTYKLKYNKHHMYTMLKRINPNIRINRGSWRYVNGIEPDPSTWKSKGSIAEWWLSRGVESDTLYRPISDGPSEEWCCRANVTVDLEGTDSIQTFLFGEPYSPIHIRTTVHKKSIRDKESLHLALPFNIPNATVRIGVSDTFYIPGCRTPGLGPGQVPGSNNDFFCAQRWIDVSNDSMGVTIVCPQGALWEVGEMVDERKVNPGKGTNPDPGSSPGYKAWKTEAKSSSTIYLYALNNYWHTNFKADQEGPITFDLYLKMHGPFKLEEARRFGLEMTRPLITWWK